MTRGDLVGFFFDFSDNKRRLHRLQDDSSTSSIKHSPYFLSVVLHF